MPYRDTAAANLDRRQRWRAELEALDATCFDVEARLAEVRAEVGGALRDEGLGPRRRRRLVYGIVSGTVIATLAVSCALTVGHLRRLGRAYDARGRHAMVRHQLRLVRDVARMAFLLRGGPCPTSPGLVAAKELDAVDGRDPWQHPFNILCEDSEVTVRSAGPDGVWHSDDDITIGPASQPEPGLGG